MRVVGVFDSGLGGLITARLLTVRAPGVAIHYYGDTAHLPYGDKSPAQIRSYVREIVRFLVEAGAESIAIACNTASAVAVDVAQAVAGSLPVFDAISPALKLLSSKTFPEPIGVVGTYTTIRSGIYGEHLRAKGYEVKELATPVLVPLIEEGWVDHPATEAALRTYLDALGEVGTLLLACTHYPLLLSPIRRYYRERGWNVSILSTAALLADAVAEALAPPVLGSAETASTFWVSDLSPRFLQLAAHFWGAPLELRESSAVMLS
ncbi:MAG: glutamate racemase [Bacteroidia bacterium]|nr:glutamate racemase [Bacteroidia bacterium]